MPKLLWTSGEKVAEAIYQEWLASGDIRTTNLRRKYGLGIYQASRRFFGTWWNAAAKGGVPKHALGQAAAYYSSRDRLRPGNKVSLPCRTCGGWIRFSIRNGTTVLACRLCVKPMTVTVAFEDKGWRIRTR